MRDFVLMVGLSPKHFIAVARAPGLGEVPAVLEQACGFLYARGAMVFRVDLRCRTSLFEDDFGQLDWRRCLLYFAKAFLAEDPTLAPHVPADAWRVAPVSVVSDAGRCRWREVEQVMEGVEAADADLLPELASSLATMARRWELHLARYVLVAERFGAFDASDRDAVAQCDRQFSQLMGRYAPGHELLPPTLARLL